MHFFSDIVVFISRKSFWEWLYIPCLNFSNILNTVILTCLQSLLKHTKQVNGNPEIDLISKLCSLCHSANLPWVGSTQSQQIFVIYLIQIKGLQFIRKSFFDKANFPWQKAQALHTMKMSEISSMSNKMKIKQLIWIHPSNS